MWFWDLTWGRRQSHHPIEGERSRFKLHPLFSRLHLHFPLRQRQPDNEKRYSNKFTTGRTGRLGTLFGEDFSRVFLQLLFHPPQNYLPAQTHVFILPPGLEQIHSLTPTPPLLSFLLLVENPNSV